jgi:hypothetical protein
VLLPLRRCVVHERRMLKEPGVNAGAAQAGAACHGGQQHTHTAHTQLTRQPHSAAEAPCHTLRGCSNSATSGRHQAAGIMDPALCCYPGARVPQHTAGRPSAACSRLPAGRQAAEAAARAPPPSTHLGRDSPRAAARRGTATP